MKPSRLRATGAAFVATLAFAIPAYAKLPPPSDEQKAAAAAAAEKAAAAAKVDAEALARAQDRVVDAYAARLKAEGKPLPPGLKSTNERPHTETASPAASTAASKAPHDKP
jgi:hypothetical protein